LQPTTHLSTPKGWKAESADIQRTVYQHKWSPVSCRSSAGQGEFAGQTLTFYHCATQPIFVVPLFTLLCSEMSLVELALDLISWAWWNWLLTWLTNHCPSVLWHWWVGHLMHEIIPEMTYVLSGTLNPTICNQ